jgi:hypothetical protein
VSNYRSVHLPHLLKPNGTLAPLTGPGLNLAKYWTEIVAQASNYDEPTTLRCRRRPGLRPWLAMDTPGAAEFMALEGRICLSGDYGFGV